jgi:threonine dehydrogenase-like Zn-dependent dehydrogenase
LSRFRPRRSATSRCSSSTTARRTDLPRSRRRTHARTAASASCGSPCCKVAHLRATLLRGFERVVVWGAGPVGKAFARELGEQVVAFVDVDPRKLGKTVYGVPVVAIDDAPRFSGALAIGAVAGEEARAEIRAAVAAQGRRDGVDFVAVA